jgi:hypothetical protein
MVKNDQADFWNDEERLLRVFESGVSGDVKVRRLQLCLLAGPIPILTMVRKRGE